MKKYKLDKVRHVRTQMISNLKLGIDQSTKPNLQVYTDMFGSLRYLTRSRLDIMLWVCLCTNFQSAPKESHVTTAKMIFRYPASAKGHVPP